MISKRLKAVCDMVDDSQIYDIGCDHALLDIYLTKYCNIKCIAIDINTDAALKNISKNNLEDKIEVLTLNAFNNMNLNSLKTSIITGMGSLNIIKILEKNLTKTLILGSNNDNYLLRKYLKKINYKIIDEKLIFEKNKYYVIIKASKGRQKYREIDYFIGPIISKMKSLEYYNYLKKLNNNKYLKIEHKNIIKKELEKFKI